MIKLIEAFLLAVGVVGATSILMVRHGILPSWNPKDYEDKSESEPEKKEE